MMEGVRDSIRKHSTATIVTMAVVVAAALFFTLRNASSSTSMTEITNKVYCTTDDGQTTFVAPMSQVPPFDRDGKAAVRAYMYSCDGGKTRFVGYLERFTPEAKKRIESAKAGPGGGGSVGPGDTEVKKPGAGNSWVSRANFAEAAKVMQVTCPGGKGDAEMVMP
jgi:hypothetical protein